MRRLAGSGRGRASGETATSTGKPAPLAANTDSGVLGSRSGTLFIGVPLEFPIGADDVALLPLFLLCLSKTKATKTKATKTVWLEGGLHGSGFGRCFLGGRSLIFYFLSVTDQTQLAQLCTGEYADRGEWKRSLAECVKGMLVKHLKGYTRDELMAFFERKEGPDGLVPGWLEKHQLWRSLRGYVSPRLLE